MKEFVCPTNFANHKCYPKIKYGQQTDKKNSSGKLAHKGCVDPFCYKSNFSTL